MLLYTDNGSEHVLETFLTSDVWKPYLMAFFSFTAITCFNLEFFVLQKFLEQYQRIGAKLMLVYLFVVLHLFNQVLLKKSGHTVLGDNPLILSSISTAIALTCSLHRKCLK